MTEPKYDNGGILPNGWVLVTNNTGEPIPLISSKDLS